MNEVKTYFGPMKVYTPEETEELFVPLRDRIFYMREGWLNWESGRIFNDNSWTKVIIRGAAMHSGRSGPPRGRYETAGQWEFADRRDELQPLFDLLIEDGVLDVIHMCPSGDTGEPTPSGFKTIRKADALVTRPTGPAVRFRPPPDVGTTWSTFSDRLLFDRTGRWGMYGSDEMFGLLGRGSRRLWKNSSTGPAGWRSSVRRPIPSGNTSSTMMIPRPSE